MAEEDTVKLIAVFMAVTVALSVGLVIVGTMDLSAGDTVETESSELACFYNQYAIGLDSHNTTSRGVLSPVSSDFVFSGTAGIGLDNSNEMHYLSYDHNSKIRQLGTVKGVTIETDTDFNSADLTAFSVSVWRKGEFDFNLVGRTGNIISDLKSASGSGVTHTINFAPGDYISGVQEGDHVGYNFNGTNTPILEAINSQGESTGVSTYYLNGSRPTASNMDWQGESSLVDWANIQLLMDSPSIVFLGQSITAGSPGHSPYIHSGDADDPSTTISYKVGDTLGVSTQNFGNAECYPSTCRVSHGVTAMSSMVIPTNPKVLVIAYGHNDDFASTPINDFETDLQSIVDTAQANGMTPVLQQIYARNNEANQYDQVIEDIATAEGISMINLEPELNILYADRCGVQGGYISGYSTGSHLTELGHNVTAAFLVTPTDNRTVSVTNSVVGAGNGYDINQEAQSAFALISIIFVVFAAIAIVKVLSMVL